MKMSDEDRAKLDGALELLSIAKLPKQAMSKRDERAWRNGFCAGARHMLEILATPAEGKPLAPTGEQG